MEAVVAYLRHHHSVCVCGLSKITRTSVRLIDCKKCKVGLSYTVRSKWIGQFWCSYLHTD